LRTAGGQAWCVAHAHCDVLTVMYSLQLAGCHLAALLEVMLC
jgi:hypothetical protein